MATAAVERVSPLVAPTVVRGSVEREQPKIALPSQLPQHSVARPVVDDSARSAALAELDQARSKVAQVEQSLASKRVVDAEVLRHTLESVRGNFDRARGAVDAMALAAPPTLSSEQLAGDRRVQAHGLLDEAESWGGEALRQLQAAVQHQPRRGDPLLNVHESSLRMAVAVGEIMNDHSMRLDRNTEAVRRLTELRSLLEVYKPEKEVDFTNPKDENERLHFERIVALLPVARQHGVLWPEGELGWKNEREREARCEGIEMARAHLGKERETLALRLHQAQNTYNQHLMNAAYSAQRQAKIIDLIIQLLSRS